MRLFGSVISLLVLGVTASYAQEGCAKFVISNPDAQCKDLKVSVDLKACADDAGKGGAATVVCSASSATFKTDSFEYTAELAKSEEWGKVKWSVGERSRQKLEVKPAQAEVSAGEAPTPSTWPEFHGFFDTQYQYRKNSKSPGFQIYDGALYVSKSFDKLEFSVDLPFSWRGMTTQTSYEDTNSDGNLDTAVESETNTNDFKFASSKAQAYAKYTFDNGVYIQGGQFDTIYGFELNDSKDLALTTPGAVFNAALPVTHLGVLAGYSLDININGRDLGTFGVKGLVSNPQNQGSSNGSNLEFGGQLTFANDSIRFAAGYLGWNQDGPAGMYSLYDVVAGFTWERITFDAEFDMKKVGAADAGLALMAHAVISVTDPLSLAARGEWIKKMGNHSLYQGTFGPQYKVNDNLKMKADYTFTRTQEVSGGTKDDTHSVNAGFIFQF